MRILKLVVAIVDEHGVELAKEEVPITTADIMLIQQGDPDTSVELFNPICEVCEKISV